jgi:branched-chain amino acid transport system substrate-binding protein
MQRSDRLPGLKRPSGRAFSAAVAQPRPETAPADSQLPPEPAATRTGAATAPAALAVAAADSGSPGPQEPMEHKGFRVVDRRALLRLAGTAAIAVPATSLLAACGGSKGSGGVRPVRIGMVTPQSGSLSTFAETDLYVTDFMRSYFKSHGGIAVGNSTHPVEIFVRDSQSTFARAGTATTQLIYDDGVDIVLVDATSDTVNPVADQCEVAGIPCISTMAPWESWYYSRGGDPALKVPFNWTFHFFAGLADYYKAYAAMWNGGVQNNKTVGALWPNNVDGQYFSNPNMPFRQGLDPAWKLVNPKLGPGDGSQADYLYPPGTPDFSQLVDAFKSNNAQIITGVLSDSDLAQFIKDANAVSYYPKIITVSKAAMFDDDMSTVIGAASSNNLTTEFFWSASSPNRSFVTNQTSKDLAAKYLSSGGPQTAPQQLGATVALFDVAAQALGAVNSLDDRKSLATALRSLNARTILGDVKFGASGSLPPNVATVGLNGAQWRFASYQYSLIQVVNSSGDQSLPNQGQIAAITQNT